ncbi:MAG TPA: DUF1152 domain-containing protein [Solirubrobacterales bacterium]|nr:DUF1152 domain-containing protein [Solirubrobacterales bacterium]
MGGGGDVVGALATARLCQAFGAEFVLGGVAWERWPIDPYPGPRGMGQILGGEPIASSVVLAEERTTTPLGTPFAEARMAGYLCSPTLLVDVMGGAAGTARGLGEAAERLGADLLVVVDVGGDVLGHGDEPGLASPLCDAVMLAAAVGLGEEIPVVCGVYGAGCDGELTPAEVAARLSEVAATGAMLGAWGLTPDVCEQLETAAQVVPTEASVLGVRCARGETGVAEIRGGLRSVELTPLGAITFYFDPVAATAAGAAPLAAAVAGSETLEEAQQALAARGVRTELDLERARERGEEPLGTPSPPGDA